MECVSEFKGIGVAKCEFSFVNSQGNFHLCASVTMIETKRLDRLKQIFAQVHGEKILVKFVDKQKCFICFKMAANSNI